MPRGRPPKMIPAETQAEVMAEASGQFDTNVSLSVEDEVVAQSVEENVIETIDVDPENKQTRVIKLIEHLKGRGLGVAFDADGVTFRRGNNVEFINYSASDRLIVSVATRIAG